MMKWLCARIRILPISPSVFARPSQFRLGLVNLAKPAFVCCGVIPSSSGTPGGKWNGLSRNLCAISGASVHVLVFRRE